MDRRPDGRRGKDHLDHVGHAARARGHLGRPASTRTEPQTSPEELLAAAHASCFAMQFTAGLVGSGWEPEEMQVECDVSFEVGLGITQSRSPRASTSTA